MSDAIFIPEKIKVGFQERKDTYTKKLAYVIYYDEKGKLRKERSWESWRDENIAPECYENCPTDGFVLNKKVGGYASDWGNFRQAYTRVYDPRGFEFEITVPNLLYILENNNCIKGKGLEGEFVYAWDGTELLLLPTTAPEFKKHKEFTDSLFNKDKITAKTIVKGGTYRDKKNKELVYLGKFEFKEGYGKWDYDEKLDQYVYKPVFYYLFKDSTSYNGLSSYKSLGHLVKVVSTEPVLDYAELMDELDYYQSLHPIDPERDEYPLLTEFKDDYQTKYVYFDVNDAKLHVSVYWNTYHGYWYFGKVERVKPEPNARITGLYYQNRDEWYYDWYKDDLVMELTKEFEPVKNIDGIMELARKYGFSYKKRYLTNGKEARQFNLNTKEASRGEKESSSV